ncbi:MAG: hypothetical protein GFH27_549283n311 [Chloroflexi bacterium AL-W]|nr:hypothetical protein [Chloroflexi bacterium AL-N1]NOK64567.1 hypothetical protein [Chloroflexi bacterium AL-N10]NOK75809.1 hypothetical protein [Chloroflexi bacterium AL-N5]NOK80432.1 hypothetical protein [Chloroflexi bacterium AL-W]NOK86946.1 hypothetical protein [Chloroflexi bacterium AL-N15]
MDIDDMYRRGISDAEHGEPHPFYYQHYYHYRRGYDRASRRLRRPAPWKRRQPQRLFVLIGIATLLVLGIGALITLRDDIRIALQSQPTADPALTSSPTPTRQPIFPTATLVATATPVALRTGGNALVVIAGSNLRARQEPGLTAPLTTSFASGEEVRILDGPIEADGYVWWQLEGPSGTGWSAEAAPNGDPWIEPQ